MADGEIDYSNYSPEQLVRVLRRLDAQQYPLNHANAWRELKRQWPDVPENLDAAFPEVAAQTRTPPQTLSDGSVVFSVSFSPPNASEHFGPPPNNLKLAGQGKVTVSADAVSVDGKGTSLITPNRRFAKADIANVGYAAAEEIVVLRTRADDRHVALWMETREDALALIALLPNVTTPEFLEQQNKTVTFREHMRTIAPKAPVTPTLIGLNVALFLVMLVAGAGLMGDDPQVHLKFGSNYGPLTWNGEPWRLLTCAFIHFGVIHIGFNMYALYNGGDLTERMYGSARFIVIYLLSALAGSVASSWWNPLGNSAGASGAIFGVYGALMVFFALRRADLPAELLKSVARGGGTLLIYSLVLGATNPVIDNAAHIGGLLGGALAGLLLIRPFNPEARKVPQPLRLVIACVVVCAALALPAMQLLPGGSRSASIESAGALRVFADAEEKIASHYRVLYADMESKKISPVRAGELIEKEILEPWRNATRQLLAAPLDESADSKRARVMAAMRKYAVAREEAYVLTVDSLKQPNEETDAKANAAWQKVQAQMDQITAISEEK